MGYVMVSRALLQEICEKKGAACCEEEAFLRVLTNVNFKPAVVFCNGAWGAVCPWRVRHHFYGLGGHIRLDKGAYPALFRPVLRCRTYRARAGLLSQPHPCARL